jgi:myo-inositol 2-dehydrogenase/D-chiro-inositol 1-dehydrogenase
VGIIGAGIMGADHARIFARQIAGVHLEAISDADQARASGVAAETGARRVITDPHALINDPEVGAILIASPDATHAEYTLACIKAGKAVLCEKPLAPIAGECLKVVEAEMAAGRRLVQVGFMRRFDPAYTEMRAALHSGLYGEALALHCAHRNASAPSFFNSANSIVNSFVHEVDIIRWLLSSELTSIKVFKAKKSSLAHFDDPMLVVCETSGGHLADVELFLNAQYGYDIKGEMLCEKGTISLAPPVNSEIRSNGANAFSMAADWRPRFAAAYRIQNQAWIDSIRGGKPQGSNAWDGYVATTVTDAGVRSLQTGQAVNITLDQRPSFYD